MCKQVSVSFHKPSLPRSTPADGIIQVLTLDPEEWKQRAQQRPDDQSALIDLIVFALLLIVLLMILRNVSCAKLGLSAGWRVAEAGGASRLSYRYQGRGTRGPSNSSWSDSSGGGSFGGGDAFGSW